MLSLVESLDEALMGDEPDFDTEAEAAANAEQADRFLFAIARLEEKADQVSLLADERRITIDLWETVERTKLQKRIDWYAEALELYHRNRLAQDPRLKTISLPSGRLESRAQQPEWRFESVEAFVDWAIHNDRRSLIRIPEPAPEPDKAKVKAEVDVRDGLAYDKATGEQIPGLIVITRERKFTIKADPDDAAS